MKDSKVYGITIDDRFGAPAPLGIITGKLANFMLINSPGKTTDPEIKRRLIFLAFLSLTGSFTLFFFGILSCIQNDLVLGVFDLTMGVFLSINLLDARRRSNPSFNMTLALSVFSVFYIYLYISGGFNQTAFVWYYTYPLVACFLLGAKRGAIASSILVIPVLLMLFTRPSHPFFAVYQLDFEIRFLFSYTMVALFSFFIENGSESNLKEIYAINANLESLVAERTKELSAENLKHKRAKTQLKESEHHYRTMFEKSVNAVFLVDKKSGRYVDANPAAEHLTGRSKQNLLSLTTKDITPQSSENRLRYLSDSEATIESSNITYIQPDGTRRQAVFNAVSLTDDIAMGIAQDITELKKAEKERQKLESRLVQSQKMEAIGNLAGGIAHDFNNILASVLGFTELSLDDTKEGSVQQENLQEVYAAGLRAKELVNQILAFARQSEASLKPIEVKGIVEEVLKLLRATIPTTIDIRLNLNSNAVVMANETQMHQILMNLCTNAAHAMHESGGVLAIDLQEISATDPISYHSLGLKSGNYVVLSVSDTGKGIEPAILNSIFEPYFTTKKIGEGTGMGLAMVKGIVETYGGSIQVESIPLKSTIFTVYLPITKSRGDNIIHEKKHLPTGSEHILLIDDEPPIARMGTQLLESLGYSVTARTSSYEALELFREKSDAFDIVITDMTMPQMTGAELASQLIELQPEIPVILCSGYSDQISAAEAAQIGVKEFVYKPFTKAELSEKIQCVLGKN
ncbi:MAG: response regulator [Desulfocapsaceae bacterium]|nr:response regulator [Desulfocapsaceae bacterium]